MNISIRSTKLKYRLLADGTIIDQETNQTVGWITSRSDLDELWAMGGPQRQKYIKEYLKK
jgi:hypothetical protein